jgi:hypothetical protein
MTSPTADVTQRLDRLERENRRLKRIGGVVLVTLAAVVLMGQATPGKVAKVVEAEKFVLRDRAGQLRATLAADANVATFALYGSKEQLRAAISVSRDVSDLSLWDGEGRTSAFLATGLGGGLLEIASSSKSEATLMVHPDGATPLLFGRVRPQNEVRNALDGHLVAILGRRGLGKPVTDSSLVLFDKDGKVIWRAP